MMVFDSLFLVPYVSAIAITATVAALSWRKTTIPGASSFSVYAAAQTLWTLGNLVKILSPGLVAKIVADDVAWVGALLSPAAFVVFAFDFTDRDLVNRRRAWTILLAPSLLGLLAAIAGAGFGLFGVSYAILPGSPFDSLEYDLLAPPFLLIEVWSYLLVLVGFAIFLLRLVRSQRLFRLQSLMILGGFLLPVLGSLVVFTSDFRILGQRDLSPYTFSLGAAIILAGIRYFDLFALAPVARDIVVERLNDAVLVVDGAERLIDFNRAAELIADFDRRRSIGRPLPGPLAGLGSGGAVGLRRLACTDGRERWFEIDRNSLGSKKGWVILFRDVSERVESEHRLEETRRRLGEAQKQVALARFVANIAHEVNGPTAAVKASSGLVMDYLSSLARENSEGGAASALLEGARRLSALRGEIDPSFRQKSRAKRELVQARLAALGIPEAERLADRVTSLAPDLDLDLLGAGLREGGERGAFLRAIELGEAIQSASIVLEASDRLGRAVYSLSRYAGIESELAASAPVPLVESVEFELELLANAGFRDIQIERDFAGLPERATCPGSFGNVWHSLIKNACQAAYPSGRVGLRAGVEEGGWISVSIENDGPPIPAEVLPRIFESFFSTREAGEGRGLGLSVSKSIVERAGGTIDFSSSEKNTVFKVRFPLAKTSSTDDEAGPTAT